MIHWENNPSMATPLSAENLNNMISDILLAAHPVGSIYISQENTSPATLFGGTWEAWGTGRVPVGVDTSQTEFDTVEKTGGDKTHTHGLAAGFAQLCRVGGVFLRMALKTTESWNHGEFVQATSGNTEIAANTAGVKLGGATDSGNNLPPYITCYMFKRTA